MSVSFEALAMAGVDYNEWGMSMEEWERLEATTPPHLLAEEDEQESERYKDHTINLKEVPEFFPSTSEKVEESRDKYKGGKKLPTINLVKQLSSKRMVKQLSSKAMMLERILPTETNCTSKVQPEKWKKLLRVLVLEFKRMFSV